MATKTRSLKQSILRGAVGFILLLCVVLSIVQYVNYQRLLYGRYEEHISNLLNYVAGEIDVDDLQTCIETGQESEGYHRLQTLLDAVKERSGIHFIYVIVPLNTEPYDNVRNVIAGATQYEYEHEADELVHLNSMTGDAFSPETAKKYLDAYQSGKLSFFEERSAWGDDYTGMLPLRNSSGQQVAALCIDEDVAEIHTELRNSILLGISTVCLLGIGCVAVFLFWATRNITEPIEQLEASVVDFASKCRGHRDPDALVLEVPQIHTSNEVETLAEAVSQMSEAMQDYVKGMVSAENAARAAEQIAELKQSVSSLLDNMPGMYFSKDAETGVYLTCNQAFAEYAHKANPQEVVGLTDAQIFDAATTRQFARDDRMALSMDEPYIFFEEVRDAAGEMRQLQTTKLKFVDATGQPCLLGICQDVTDMVRIQRENATTKEAYEQARSAGIIYSHLARALARGYADLYYVNLDTEEFIEYRTDDEGGALAEARRGWHFFERCKIDANVYVHPDDRDAFVRAMERKTLVDALDRNGTFMMTYRLLGEDEPTYVSMRVSRMEDDDSFMVIGVTDVDEQMKRQRAAERMREEHIAYTRINALNGEYLCVYVVDPETDRYREFSATTGFESYALEKEGTDFFTTSRENGRKVVHPDDLGRYLSIFTRERVLKEVAHGGVFSLTYRLFLEGKPIYVQLRAVIVEEAEGPRLIVGLSDIDSHVRQEEDYERRLAQAQREANVDALTGVKNKHAYLDAEEHLNRQIEERRAPSFAIVILDVNDLKTVNDSEGHKAGDQYLRDACRVVCHTFKHSPVFRVGGDEFAVISQGDDYERIDELMGRMSDYNTAALRNGGIVIACGMARYAGEATVAAVFERADYNMYENKSKLKASA